MASSLLVVMSISCGGSKSAGTTPTQPGQEGTAYVPVDSAPVDTAPDGGLTFTLEELSGTKASEAKVRTLEGTPLSAKESTALWSGVPKLPTEKGDVVTFNKREGSTPPPTATVVVKEAFPPPASGPIAGAAEKKPLEIVRFAPEGEIGLLRELSVTFNQSMVPLTSHGQSVSGNLPVSFSPMPKGQFRWVGTSTLLFTAEPRFPFATEFTVTIPKGAKSESGQTLAKEKTFRFHTPRLEISDVWPNEDETTSLTPLLYLVFNQKVDAQKALAAVSVEAGGQKQALRLATPEEIAADENISARIEGLAGEGMREFAVVLRPGAALPYAAKVTLSVPIDSAFGEGPLGTSKALTKNFRTHGPLKLKAITCHAPCPPGGGVQIELTNPLDPEAFEESWVRIEPAVAFQVSPSGDSLYLSGETTARTEYKVSVSGAVKDQFGQRLGQDQSGTFKVGDASPELDSLPQLVLLDPKAPSRTLAVQHINVDALDIEVRRVTPADYLAFAKFRERSGDKNPPKLPGQVVDSQKVAFKDKKNVRTTTLVDVTKGLSGGLGHVIVSITPRPQQGKDFWLPRSDVWVQSTGLGLDAFWDGTELVSWATSLADGSPQKDVVVTLDPDTTSATSDADGLARMKLPQGDAGNRVRVLVAKRGNDVAILPEHPWGAHGGGTWTAQPAFQGVRTHVFDDRGLYRPGEAVHLKGWLRLAQGQGSIALPKGKVAQLTYEVTSQGGESVAKGTAKLNDLGGFDASFTLPKTVHLGQANVHFKADLPNGEFWHGFRIEEYRRPEYEVKVSSVVPVHFSGQKSKFEAKASYHAGGALSEAKTVWSVTSRSAHFAPPGREGFLFGEQPMFWERMWFPRQPERNETITGRTDGQGVHAIGINLAKAQPAFVHELEVSARVEDLSRQGFADTTTVLVHPADVYVGLRTNQSFTREGETIDADAIVTDLDGKAVAGRPVTLALIELTGKFEKGRYKTEETEVERCNVSSTDEVVKCALHPKRAGSYRVAARVTDAKQRPNDTHLRHWVSGESGAAMVSANPGQLELVPDKKSYQPGETAHVMVRAPFAPGDALVRISHEKIVELRRLDMKSAATTIDVKIGAEHVPNLSVAVELVGRAPGSDGSVDLPARASGEVDLTVSLDARKLAVEAKPDKRTLEPGQKTRIEVTVKNAKGEPQKSADVALIVVDEAILQMLAREEVNPVESMHPHVDPAGGSVQSRNYVLVPQKTRDQAQHHQREGGVLAGAMGVGVASRAMAESAPAPMADMAMAKSGSGAPGNAASPVKMRSLFEPLALFAASLRTDEKGRVSADVTMPDTLTRYRVLAVAAAGDVFFGQGESSLTVQKQLMLRPAVSRFTNLGDELSLPVLVQNEGDSELTVDVGVRAANFTLSGPTDKRITVPAHDRIEVRFAGKPKRPGTVRMMFVAKAKGLNDGTELSFPTYTPATDEAFATYGDVEADGVIAQGISLPQDVAKEFGGLDVSLSSTQVAALTDAMLSVLESPFDFPEQSASRILTVIATRDILSAFAAEGLPSRADLDASIARDVSRLSNLQRPDGGYGFYDLLRESDPYTTVHVSHALARAKAEKIAIPADLENPVRNYVRNLIAHDFKDEGGAETRAAVLAYAAFSERAWGANDAELAKQALASLPLAKHSAEGLGWLLPVLKAQQSSRVPELVRALQNRVSETAGKAEIRTSESDGRHVILASDKRETAVVLDGLLASDEAKDLAPKLARGLLAGQRRGKWQGTQENVFALLALRRFFETYEKDVPSFSARAFVDATLAAEKKFEGRSTTQTTTRVPMAWLVDHKSGKLAIEKRGKGRLYYRLALAYAPSDYLLPAADHGFVVERRYESVDAPEDVQRDVQGAYRVRAGARVKVTVTMVATGTRHHVALVDPLPAGFEAINPALAVSERVPNEPGFGRGRPPGDVIPFFRMIWPGPWFEFQNLRDERAEAHASEVGAGVYTYTYFARATTPGRFVAPPPKAEELYAPETFGRGESARVIVE